MRRWYPTELLTKPLEFPFGGASPHGVSQKEKVTSLGERGRAAGSCFCALLLAALAALFFLSGSMLFAWVAVLPALLAGLLLYAAIHALLASGTPPTTLVLGKEPLRREVPTSVRIRQAGPVSFQSLRANLVCERIERPPGARSRSITYPHQINFFDAGACKVPHLHTEELRSEMTVPAVAEPSSETPRLKVRWRLAPLGVKPRRGCALNFGTIERGAALKR